MKVKIFDTLEQIGEYAAQLFIEQINEKPDSVLGLATGASPVPTYNALTQAYKNGKVSFSQVKTFNLDEYCDLARDDKNSYYTFMHENLFNHIDIKEENVHFLNGCAPDAQAECKAYDELINQTGGIDMQLLGIGNNAHIAFNEPADMFSSGSYRIKLTDSTVEANKIYFEKGNMPRYALTMGIGMIVRAKSIILIATGPKKASAVYNMLENQITPHVPASILQRHGNCTVLLDAPAASMLTKEYND